MEQYSVTIPIEFLNVIKWGAAKDHVLQENIKCGHWDGDSITATDGHKLISYRLKDEDKERMKDFEPGNYRLHGNFIESIEMESECYCNDCYGNYYINRIGSFGLKSTDKQTWTGDGFYLKKEDVIYPDWENVVKKKSEESNFTVRLNPMMLAELTKAITGTPKWDANYPGFGVTLKFNTKNPECPVKVEYNTDSNYTAVLMPMRMSEERK